MQKYVIEKSLSKHLIKVNGGKSKANDDKAMIMTRPVPLGFFINKFPLWDGAGLWPIKVSQACPTG